MAVTFGFYNSLNGDRKYDARDFASIFDGIINDGIFMSVGTSMVVTPAGDMNINVGIGRAWFNSTWTYNDAILPLTLPPSEVVLNRIDAVVLEIDTSIAVRINSIKIIKGTPSNSPVNPTLIKSDVLNQYPLAYIYVGNGVDQITHANITNKVGTSDTPFITGILETMNIDALIIQWGTQWNEWTSQQQTDFLTWMLSEQNDYDTWSNTQKDAFYAWFNQFKDVIDENAAANILTELRTHKYDYTKHIYYGSATGTDAKVITVASDPLYPISYVDGLAISFKNLVTNGTGTATLNVNGLGAKNIMKSNGDWVRAGELKQNGIYTVRYNGTSFILQGEGGSDGEQLAKYGNKPGQISTFELFMNGFSPKYIGGGI